MEETSLQELKGKPFQVLYDRLASHRFTVSRGNVTLIRNVDRHVEELKGRYPWLLGVSYYGSRLMGTDTPSSDLDYVLWYDGNAYRPDYDGDDALNDMANEVAKVAGNKTHLVYPFRRHYFDLWARIVFSPDPLVTSTGYALFLRLFFLSNSPKIITLRKDFLSYLREHVGAYVFADGKPCDEVVEGAYRRIFDALGDVERGMVLFEGQNRTERHTRPELTFPFGSETGASYVDNAQWYFSRTLAGVMKKHVASKANKKA